jgi:hypothetical protein
VGWRTPYSLGMTSPDPGPDVAAQAGDSSTVADLVAAGTRALEALASVGEAVEDELQYVADLVAVYRGRFGQVAAERGAEAVRPEQVVAVAVAAEEAGLIVDPHRAIDWLSTLPQVVLFTIGETA